jgi:hypothetical protein
MKKVMFFAVAACLMMFAACGNGGGTKDNKEANNTKKEVVIPADFLQYDCSGLTISYPNDLHVTWDGDEMVNLANEDHSVFIDATFSSWGTKKSQLKDGVKNFVSLFKNQGWEPIGDVVIDDNIGTCRLENEEEVNNFFIVCGEDSHSVSGSVKYDKEMAEAFEAYVTPIIYSIKVK